VDNDGNALVTGALYFDTTANEMRVWNGSSWVAAGSAVNGTSSRQVYTATGGQTTFAIVYDVGYVDVYLNGVKQVVGVDFTATSGTNVVFTAGLVAGDIVDIVAYGAFNVANTYTQAQADALLAGKLSLTGGTMTGAITFAAAQFGTNVGTFLATPSSANLAAAVTDETGSGALVFATSPTLVTPALGTPASGNLSNTTADGTNSVGYKNLPAVGTKTSSYTLAVGDIGKYVQLGASGAIVIPDATFSEGNAITVFNNTASTATITCSITTAYIAGTFTDKATMTLAAAGVATILFISGTVCVVAGNVT
jgi:hypothetical protein